jgi:hypothetical protein
MSTQQELAAFQMSLQLPAGARMTSIRMPSRSEQVYFHQQGDVVHMGWFDAQAQGWTPAGAEVFLELTIEGMESHEGVPFSLVGASEATDTRGVIHSGVQLEVPRLSRTAEAFKSEVYPNPTTGPISIRLNLPEAGRVEVYAVDVLGKTVPMEVATEPLSILASGSHEFILSLGTLTPGCYSLIIRFESASSVKKNSHKIIIIN